MASSRGTSGNRLGLGDCVLAGYESLAEPVALDAVDPDDRAPDTFQLGDPRVVNDARTPGHTKRLWHPDEQSCEIAGAVGVVTGWLHRHGCSL